MTRLVHVFIHWLFVFKLEFGVVCAVITINFWWCVLMLGLFRLKPTVFLALLVNRYLTAIIIVISLQRTATTLRPNRYQRATALLDRHHPAT